MKDFVKEPKSFPGFLYIPHVCGCAPSSTTQSTFHPFVPISLLFALLPHAPNQHRVTPTRLIPLRDLDTTYIRAIMPRLQSKNIIIPGRDECRQGKLFTLKHNYTDRSRLKLWNAYQP